MKENYLIMHGLAQNWLGCEPWAFQMGAKLKPTVERTRLFKFCLCGTGIEPQTYQTLSLSLIRLGRPATAAASSSPFGSKMKQNWKLVSRKKSRKLFSTYNGGTDSPPPLSLSLALSFSLSFTIMLSHFLSLFHSHSLSRSPPGLIKSLIFASPTKKPTSFCLNYR